MIRYSKSKNNCTGSFSLHIVIQLSNVTIFWYFCCTKLQKPSHLKMRIVLLSFVTKDFAVKNDCKLQMSCAQNWNVTQLLAAAES